jgi:ketosteroid isomerase-like protein
MSLTGTYSAGFQARLERLLDMEDIREVLRRYTRGLDRHDEDVIASAFWPDAEINYLNDFSGPTREFVMWGNQRHEDRYVVHQHHITNVNIDLDGDVAHVSSYLICILRGKDDRENLGSGRYIDQFQKRDGEWRIAIREFLPEMRFSVPVPPMRELPRPPGNSRWDREDLSYQRPLKRRDDRR